MLCYIVFFGQLLYYVGFQKLMHILSMPISLLILMLSNHRTKMFKQSWRNVFHWPICYAYFAKYRFQIWCKNVHQFSYGPEKLKPPRPVTRKKFPFDDVIMSFQACTACISELCNHWWIFYTSLACQFQTHRMPYSIKRSIWNSDTFIVNASRHLL